MVRVNFGFAEQRSTNNVLVFDTDFPYVHTRDATIPVKFSGKYKNDFPRPVYNCRCMGTCNECLSKSRQLNPLVEVTVSPVWILDSTLGRRVTFLHIDYKPAHVFTPNQSLNMNSLSLSRTQLTNALQRGLVCVMFNLGYHKYPAVPKCDLMSLLSKSTDDAVTIPFVKNNDKSIFAVGRAPYQKFGITVQLEVGGEVNEELPPMDFSMEMLEGDVGLPQREPIDLALEDLDGRRNTLRVMGGLAGWMYAYDSVGKNKPREEINSFQVTMPLVQAERSAMCAM